MLLCLLRFFPELRAEKKQKTMKKVFTLLCAAVLGKTKSSFFCLVRQFCAKRNRVPFVL